jgi:hypothetical protein
MRSTRAERSATCDFRCMPFGLAAAETSCRARACRFCSHRQVQPEHVRPLAQVRTARLEPDLDLQGLIAHVRCEHHRHGDRRRSPDPAHCRLSLRESSCSRGPVPQAPPIVARRSAKTQPLSRASAGPVTDFKTPSHFSSAERLASEAMPCYTDSMAKKVNRPKKTPGKTPVRRLVAVQRAAPAQRLDNLYHHLRRAINCTFRPRRNWLLSFNVSGTRSS